MVGGSGVVCGGAFSGLEKIISARCLNPKASVRVKSGVCVPSSLERPPGSPAGPELPNPFVSGCALEVATFCARRLVPDRRPAQVRH